MLRFERYFRYHGDHGDGRRISQSVASLKILVYDVINVLYYERGTDKQK